MRDFLSCHRVVPSLYRPRTRGSVLFQSGSSNERKSDSLGSVPEATEAKPTEGKLASGIQAPPFEPEILKSLDDGPEFSGKIYEEPINYYWILTSAGKPVWCSEYEYIFISNY